MGNSETGTDDVLLKNEKFKKCHRYWMEMVEYLKLFCDGELAFGGEGEVCERKCYVFSGQGVCWRQGELTRNSDARDSAVCKLSTHYARCCSVCSLATYQPSAFVTVPS
jgi:hypothetical protein